MGYHDIHLGAWSENMVKIASACKELQDSGLEMCPITKYWVMIGKEDNVHVDVWLYHLKKRQCDNDMVFLLQSMSYLLWILRIPDENKIDQANTYPA